MNQGNQGVAALPTVIVISAVVIIIGISIAGSGFIESLASFGDFESKRALYAAEAGAQDVLKKLVRNKNCSCNYQLSVDGGTATITVSGTNPKTIVSVGEVGLKKRKVALTVSWDANDKAVYTSWKETVD